MTDLRPKRIGLLVCLLVLSISRSAVAQDHFNPIGADDLDRYLRLLDASGQQRLAALAAHEEYAAQYQVIREGPIAEYRASETDRAAGFPDVAWTREHHRKREQIMRQIEALDASLFERLDGLLSQEQRDLLQHVRMMRERDRLPMRGIDVDLVLLVQELDPPASERAVLEPILQAYEPEFTRAVQARERRHLEWEIMVARYMEERGATGSLPDDSEERQRMMEVFAEAREETRGFREEGHRRLRDLNDRTIEAMAAVAEPPTSDRLRVAYYSKVHQGTFALDSEALATLDAAAAHSELTEEVRRDVAEVRDELRATLRGILDEQIAANEQQRERMRERRFERGAGLVHMEHMAELTERAEQAEENAMVRLSTILSPEQIAMVREHREPSAPREPAVGERQREQEEARERALAFLPPPISGRDLDLYMARLQPEDNPSDELREHHERYFIEYQTAARSAQRELLTKRQRLSDMSPLAEHEGVHRLHDAKLKELASIDDAFFSALREAIDANIEPARSMRKRQVNRAIIGAVFHGQAPPVDLTVVFLRDVEPAANVHEFEQTLRPYEGGLAAHLSAGAEGALRFVQQMELMQAYFTLRAKAENIAPPERIDPATIQRPIVEARQLSAHVVEDIAAALPPEQREQFEDAYRRAAVPEVYADADDAGLFIRRALASSDLSGDQRDRLATLLAEHQAEHRRLTGEIVEAALEARSLRDALYLDRDDDVERMREVVQAQDVERRLRNERAELNARTKQRAQAILGDR